MSEIPHEAERECGRIVSAIVDAKADFMAQNPLAELRDLKATLHLGHVQRWALKATRDYAQAVHGIQTAEETFMGVPTVFEDCEDLIQVEEAA